MDCAFWIMCDLFISRMVILSWVWSLWIWLPDLVFVEIPVAILCLADLVESGKIYLQITEVDPAAPVQRAIVTVQSAAQEKNIKLNIDIPENIKKVKADEEKATWVLTNFLTNAIKYSHDNSVVDVKVTFFENVIQFSVEDSGQGIANDHLSKIFDRFYKVPGTERTGTGLGLSISKEFIEAMGGSIGVESQPGKGSRFYFKLPIQ